MLEACGALDATDLLEAIGAFEATEILEAFREFELLFSEFVKEVEVSFEAADCWFEWPGLRAELFATFELFWMFSFDSMNLLII